LAAGRFAAPQPGQVAANGLAHSMQNLAPMRFSVPQFEQIIGGFVSGVGRRQNASVSKPAPSAIPRSSGEAEMLDRLDRVRPMQPAG